MPGSWQPEFYPVKLIFLIFIFFVKEMMFVPGRIRYLFPVQAAAFFPTVRHELSR